MRPWSGNLFHSIVSLDRWGWGFHVDWCPPHPLCIYTISMMWRTRSMRHPISKPRCWRNTIGCNIPGDDSNLSRSWGQKVHGSITDNCWRNASLPSLSSTLVTPGGTRTGKLPMIGFIRAIFRKMSEVNSSAIIPPQGSNNCYQECKWVKKKRKKKKLGKGIMTMAFDRGTF